MDGKNPVWVDQQGKVVNDDYFNTEAYERDKGQYYGMLSGNERDMMPVGKYEDAIAEARNIPSPNADNWSRYAMNAGYEQGTPVPIDDVADRTRENGWYRDYYTDGKGVRELIPWRYYPERDGRISESRLQRLYNNMMNYLPYGK